MQPLIRTVATCNRRKGLFAPQLASGWGRLLPLLFHFWNEIKFEFITCLHQKRLSCEYRPYHLHPHISHLIFVCHDIPIHCQSLLIIIDKSDHRQLTIFKIPRSEIGSISTGASCRLASRTTEVPDIEWHDDGDSSHQRSSGSYPKVLKSNWQASIVDQLLEEVPTLCSAAGSQKEREEKHLEKKIEEAFESTLLSDTFMTSMDPGVLCATQFNEASKWGELDMNYKYSGAAKTIYTQTIHC